MKTTQTVILVTMLVCAGTASAQVTKAATDLPQTATAGCITSTINFVAGLAGGEEYTISDVNVRVEVDANQRDQTAPLTLTYNGTPVVLTATGYDANSDDLYVTYDSDAATACSDGTAGCGSGTFCGTGSAITCSPDNSLAAFNGMNNVSGGAWTLEVCDAAAMGSSAAVQVFELTISGAQVPVELMSFTAE